MLKSSTFLFKNPNLLIFFFFSKSEWNISNLVWSYYLSDEIKTHVDTEHHWSQNDLRINLSKFLGLNRLNLNSSGYIKENLKKNQLYQYS